MFSMLSGTTSVQAHNGNGLNVIHRAALALTVCGAMVLGSLGLTGHAEARMGEGDRLSETAQRCGSIQDKFDYNQTLFNWLKDPILRAYHQQQIANAVDEWYIYGCDKHYGSISVRTYAVPTETNNIGDVVGNEQGPKTRKPKVGSTGNSGVEGAATTTFNLNSSASGQNAGIAP